MPFIGCYLTFNFFPMIYSFQLSFFDWNGIGPKTFVGVQNYITLFTKDPLFLKSLYNTVILVFFSTPLTVFLGLLMAYSFFNVGKRSHFYQTVNFFPYITTPVAIGFIFSYLFDWQSGYINKLFVWIGLIEEPYYWLQDELASKVIVIIMIVWRWLGYYMTIYLAAMTSISPEVYEAAKIDGARKSQMFFRITIPLLKNTTAFLVITSFIGGLQMFEEPKLLFSGWGSIGGGTTGGPGSTVLTAVWKFYNETFSINFNLGYGSAIAYSLFLFIACFSLVSVNIMRKKREIL